MFVGHYAASLAAKAAEPRAPLWTYVIGAQFLDVGWAILVAAGVEKVRVDPSLQGSTLDLYYMPWTHSLPGALAWSVLGALLIRYLLKLDWRPAAFVGLTVFSHWLGDLLVHRPDLELWVGGPKVGLGLWNLAVAEQAVEIGLVAIATAFWAGQRVREGRRIWPAALFLTFLLALQLVGLVAPMGGDKVLTAAMTLAAYGVTALIAWWIDRRPVDVADRLPAEPVRA